MFFRSMPWLPVACSIAAVVGVSSTWQLPEARFSRIGAIAVVLLGCWMFAILKQHLEMKKAIWLVGALGVFALVIESIGLLTGFPYGQFVYSTVFGGKLFGITPWTVFFAWTPFMLAAYAGGKGKWPLVITLLLVFDLVLDPGAVSQGLWEYRAGGWYYDVPWTNFAGWVLAGTIGYCVIRSLLGKQHLPFVVAHPAVVMIAFWLGVAAGKQMWLPVIIGVGLFVYLGRELYNEQKLAKR